MIAKSINLSIWCDDLLLLMIIQNDEDVGAEQNSATTRRLLYGGLRATSFRRAVSDAADLLTKPNKEKEPMNIHHKNDFCCCHVECN